MSHDLVGLLTDREEKKILNFWNDLRRARMSLMCHQLCRWVIVDVSQSSSHRRFHFTPKERNPIKTHNRDKV